MNEKKRTVITITLAIIGSLLFYKQSAGNNTLLFTVISSIILMYFNKLLEIKKLIVATAPPIICSISIVLYPQLLTRTVWLLSYLTMWSLMVPTPYVIVTFLQGITSIIKTPFSLLKATYYKKDKQTDTVDKKQSYIYFITGIIVLIFTILYINSNPIFFDFFTKIDLSFIEFGFIVTIIGMHLLLLGLIKIKENEGIKRLNTITAFITRTELSKRDEQEFKIAGLSIWMVGIILLIANITDLVVILTDKLPKGITYSEYVHQGFNTLIFTLTLAIGLVIYFYRGQLNFHKNVKRLKKASTFWIFQNLLLALITAYKNFLYVEVYGLTYKRIAVFLGLLCVIIGLILSIKKIKKPYSNWSYFNKLALNAFICIVLISLIPMDKVITNYNLSYSQTIDMDYILSLNKPDLERIKHFTKDNRDLYSKYGILINNKILIESQKASTGKWQSWNYYTYKYTKAQ